MTGWARFLRLGLTLALLVGAVDEAAAKTGKVEICISHATRKASVLLVDPSIARRACETEDTNGQAFGFPDGWQPFTN